MATTFTLKLLDRSPKKPIKKLPESIEVPVDAHFEDVKILVARQIQYGDHNRIGLFHPETKKIFKDRRALLRDDQTLLNAGQILVQDLGPQAAWRTVFMVEYLGPILFHALVVALRPYLYKGARDSPLTTVQWAVFYMFEAHFVKRELETMFVHKFSANTMPAWNIIRNSAFYWGPAGLFAAYFIYSPRSFAARDELSAPDYAGVALYLVCELLNAKIHLNLASLRSSGGTERGIPFGLGTNLVTSPNYMFEVLAWLGVIIVSREIAVVIFILIGMSYMRAWSRDKERMLRAQFGDKYKKKRYTMLPGLI